MKKTIILLVLLDMISMAGLKAQDSRPAKEWYYGSATHEIWGSRYFYQHLVTAGDTVIMGKECVIIKQAGDCGDGFSADIFEYANMGKQSFYLHREPDRLLWYNEEMGEFTTLHNYSAQAGDSWTIQVDSCSFDVVVDSTDVVAFGGKSHRVLYVHDGVNDTNLSHYYEGCIIEDVGHTKHFFPVEIYWLCQGSAMCGVPEMTGIRCVLEDGDLLYHQGEISCDSVFSISHIGIEEDSDDQDIMVYPNPVEGLLRLDFSPDVKPASVELFDLQGRLVHRQDNSFESVNMSQLPAGIYTLRVTLNDGKSFSDKVVKE